MNMLKFCIRYSTAEELHSYPVIARKDTYLGGGYVFRIKGLFQGDNRDNGLFITLVPNVL